MAPAASAAARAWRRRWASISALSTPSRRPSSPACGVRTVGADARCEVAEALGVRVEAVGVEHERHAGARGDLAGERRRAGVARQAGAEHERPAAASGLEHGVDAARGVGAVLVRQAARHDLEQALLEDELHRPWHAGRHVAGAGAHRRLGRQARRAGEPAGTAGDDDVAAGELRPPRHPRRQAGQQRLVVDEADVGLRHRRARRDADVDDAHLAGVGLARVDPQAGLGGREGRRPRGAHRLAGDRAAWRRPRRWARRRPRPARLRR